MYIRGETWTHRDSDGDNTQFGVLRQRRAKPVQCDCCGYDVEPGDMYHSVRVVRPNGWSSMAIHAACMDEGNRIMADSGEGSWQYQNLTDYAEEFGRVFDPRGKTWEKEINDGPVIPKKSKNR